MTLNQQRINRLVGVIRRQDEEIARIFRDKVQLEYNLHHLRAQRDEADAYIKSLWRNNLLPAPMPESMRDRLGSKTGMDWSHPTQRAEYEKYLLRYLIARER